MTFVLPSQCRRVLCSISIFLGCVWTVFGGEGADGTQIAAPRGSPEVLFYDDIRGGGITLKAHGSFSAFLATTAGLQLFQAGHWENLPLPSGLELSSLAPAPGRLYITSHDEFGYLDRRSANPSTYVSLKARLPAEFATTQAFLVDVHPDGTPYFSSLRRVFRWDTKTGEFSIWQLEKLLHGVFFIDQVAFAYTRYGAIFRLDADGVATEICPDFAPEAALLRANVAETEHDILMVTAQGSVYRFDGQARAGLDLSVTAWREKAAVTSIAAFPDGDFVIGTNRQGILVFAADGQFRRQVEHRSGLTQDTVELLATVDRSGVWAKLRRGVAFLDFASGFEFFGEDSGLYSSVESIVEWNGNLYVGTDSGIYRDVPAQGNAEATRFELVSAPTVLCRSLLATEHGVLAGNDSGLELWDGDRWTHIADEREAYLYASPETVGHIYLGGIDSLQIWETTPTGFSRLESIPTERVDGLVEDTSGFLWLKTGVQAVRRINLHRRPFRVERFDGQHGLDATWCSPIRIDGKLHVRSQKAVYAFDPERLRFEPSAHFKLPASERLIQLLSDDGGHWWFSTSKASGDMIALPVARVIEGIDHLSPNWSTGMQAAMIDSSGRIWAGGAEGLFAFSPDASAAPATSPHGHLVVLPSQGPGNDQTLIPIGTTSEGNPVFPPHENSFRFRIGWSDIAGLHRLRFRYRLVGQESDFSALTTSAVREYQNLSGGNYQLRVEAVDPLGRTLDRSEFAFRINPPWIHRWWARSLFVGAGVGVIGLLIWWRSQHLAGRNRTLSRLVGQRTAELRATTTELREKNAALELSNTQLNNAILEARNLATEAQSANEAKSQFLATISHEIRTPLNGIVGVLQLLGENTSDAERQQWLEMIDGCSRQLVGTIDQLLDFSKLNAGRLELLTEPFDLLETLEAVLQLLAPAAQAKGLEVICRVDPEQGYRCLGDRARIHQLIANFLSNAIKFTERGRVEAHLGTGTQNDGHEAFTLRFRDTGIGVAEADRALIFERFRQADSSLHRRYEGAGLGLAICDQLVRQMGGEIELDSELGGGSLFTVQLPLPPDSENPTLLERFPLHRETQVAFLGVGTGHGAAVRQMLEQYHLAPLSLPSLSNLPPVTPKSPAFLLVDAADPAIRQTLTAFEESPQSGHAGWKVIEFASPSAAADTALAPSSQTHEVIAPFLPTALLKALSPRRLRDSSAPSVGGLFATHRARFEGHDLAILIAEDNPMNSAVLAATLEKLGYRPRVATSGAAAIAITTSQPFDLVLMDLHMPEIDGIEATREIHRRLPTERHPRIVAISAVSTAYEGERIRDAGIDGIIPKPMELERLLTVLRETHALKPSASPG